MGLNRILVVIETILLQVTTRPRASLVGQAPVVLPRITR